MDKLTFGVLTHYIEDNQPCQMINYELNRASKKVCPILFFTECRHYYSSNYAKFPCMDVLYFRHPVIATDIKSAQLLMEAPLPTQKFFYVWNLDWLYLNKSFQYYNNIYQGIRLICRCEHHLKMLSHCWKLPSPPILIEDFNYERLCEII